MSENTKKIRYRGHVNGTVSQNEIFTAPNWREAKKHCSKNGLTLLELVAGKGFWHVKFTKNKDRQTICKLFYFEQIVETARGVSHLHRLESYAHMMNAKKMEPNKLCAADYASVDTALKSFN